MFTFYEPKGVYCQSSRGSRIKSGIWCIKKYTTWAHFSELQYWERWIQEIWLDLAELFLFLFWDYHILGKILCMCLHAQHRKLIMLENKVVVMTAGSAADIHIAAKKKKLQPRNSTQDLVSCTIACWLFYPIRYLWSVFSWLVYEFLSYAQNVVLLDHENGMNGPKFQNTMHPLSTVASSEEKKVVLQSKHFSSGFPSVNSTSTAVSKSPLFISTYLNQLGTVHHGF